MFNFYFLFYAIDCFLYIYLDMIFLDNLQLISNLHLGYSMNHENI